MTREEARATLLRALEELDDAEGDLSAEFDALHLCVIYSGGRDLTDGGWHEIGGWVKSPGPLWLHSAMLRRAADALDAENTTPDEEDE